MFRRKSTKFAGIFYLVTSGSKKVKSGSGPRWPGITGSSTVLLTHPSTLYYLFAFAYIFGSGTLLL
jgi:hypothetical protein